MSIRRLSPKLRETGYIFFVLGLIVLIVPLIIATSYQVEGAKGCAAIGLIGFLVGSVLLAAYYLCYQVSPGYALVDKNGSVELEGRYLGLPPASPTIISTARRLVEINGMELETPDDGLLGASITVSYSPDLKNAQALTQFANPAAIDRAIQNRVRGALNSWSMAKPLPGTIKRAVAMQKEAETYLLGQLGGTSKYLAPIDDPTLYLGEGIIVTDFGIRIHEINTISWRPLADGTNKPDWGDGDHLAFDARVIFKEFHAHADNLSNLRQLKEALIERYAEEAEDIEDIYDQVRMSMKETRER